MYSAAGQEHAYADWYIIPLPTQFFFKVKCDGAQPCSRCRKSETQCIFAKVAPRRGPPKQYVELLETRLRMVEKALTLLEKSNNDQKTVMPDDEPQADWEQPRYGTLGFISFSPFKTTYLPIFVASIFLLYQRTHSHI